MTKAKYFLLVGAFLFATAAHADPTGAFYRESVYGSGPNLQACKLMPGVPIGLWGNAERVETTKVVTPDGQTLTITGTREDGTKTVYRFFLQQHECLAFTQSSTANVVVDPNAEYVAKLESTYGKRLHFESPDAERIVREFNIDCRAPDGRHLPLINVLLARLASMDSKTGWLEIFVQERGGEVRIIDSLRGPKIPADRNTVAFQINKWGELRPVGITVEAVLNSCFGSYGPIWQRMNRR